ncbi:MAG: OmpA family protein [Gammaproteobacteria bacterium]|nr:OmpA family protein [Gammaproteobacteria bacterium]
MRLRIQFFAGCLLCVHAAFVSAAPPRFNAIGDAMDSNVGSVTTPEKVAAPADATPQAATAAATAAAPEVPAGVVDAKDTKAPPEEKAPAPPTTVSAEPTKPAKKSESWFARLFGIKKKPEKVVTHKPTDALVNTDTRREEVYDLLKTADVHQIEPGYDGRWHVQASKVMCRMKQKLPGYGYVEFRQGVSQPLEFALFVDHPPAGNGLVEVSSEPPIWRHYVKTKELGKLTLDDSDRAVTASTDWSRRLLLELSEGMQPVLRFWDAADASEDMEIFLSAIAFQDSLTLFHQCLGQLLKYDFNEVKDSVVHFNPDSSKLRRESYQQLDELIGIAKTDKSIGDIELKIYTYRDGLERYNYRLATRRAQGVRDYLLKHGIAEEKIFIKIYTKNKAEMRKLGYSDADVYVALQRHKPK